jgi:hypothetical protein
MTPMLTSRRRRRGIGFVFALLGLTLGACNDADQVGPSEETSIQAPADLAISAAPAGIVFAPSQLPVNLLSSVYTGTILPTSPSAILSYLPQVKARGGRVLLKLHGSEQEVENTDGTFNLTKWKTMVSRYRTVNFGPYITDGTVVGHYFIDEPHYSSRWGGKVIPQATVEAMAKYSKQLWPTMPTIVSAPPAWFANTSLTYTYLDAAWAQYLTEKSNDPAGWAARQVTLAKKKGLGLYAGMNVLDGGNGSSGVRGTVPRGWNMTASEVRTYGSALLAQSYICGFSMWRYSSTYYNKADIKTAMAELSNKARNHAKTSCRQ